MKPHKYIASIGDRYDMEEKCRFRRPGTKAKRKIKKIASLKMVKSLDKIDRVCETI